MKRPTGVYMIGALGSIATTVMAGALALRKDLVPPIGMIASGEAFKGIDLIEVGDLEFGGCDIRGTADGNILEQLRESGPISPRILDAVGPELQAWRQGFHAGTARNCGEAILKLAGADGSQSLSLRNEIQLIRDNLRAFKQKVGGDGTIVVNVASTEPPLDLEFCHADLSAFEACLNLNQVEKVRASTLYAYAAIQEGCPYINFTPSNGALLPALIQLAREKGVPVMGNDGKTGETLVKSALAPMFAYRNLEVMSWEGFNILGNMDGRVLDNPRNKESKIKTKDQVLSKILGYPPHSKVSIDYVPSLDDQKTAWDFIHFRGFLGVKMSLQFTWQGYDSILAAPLVLDMVRLAELALARGESGLMPQLAPFFKAPIGVAEFGLPGQFQMLLDYAKNARKFHRSIKLVR